jgi:hypothetical protein
MGKMHRAAMIVHGAVAMRIAPPYLSYMGVSA